MFSRKVIPVVLVASILGLNLCNPVSAEGNKDFYEQIEKLEKIAEIKKLEAEIAKYEARKAKAIAEIEKANAKRIWSKLATAKGKKALKELKSGSTDTKKEEKKEKSEKK